MRIFGIAFTFLEISTALQYLLGIMGLKISVHFEIFAKGNTAAPTFFESFIMINKSAFHSFLVLNPSLKDSQH